MNYYWFQHAAYTIATLDTVNVYTPATAQDVMEEKAYAERLCREERDRQVVQTAQNDQINSGYKPDEFTGTWLRKGDKVYRLCQDHLY